MIKPLILLVGKSGVGKNFFSNAFCLASIPSYTTREQRKSEIQGNEHTFVSLKSWEQLYKGKKNIVAWTLYNGNYYWTTKEQVEAAMYDVYIIDPDGVYNMMKFNEENKINRDLSVVYLKASIFKRIRNMYKRGDSISNIITRLINDSVPFDKFELDKKVEKLIVKV